MTDTIDHRTLIDRGVKWMRKHDNNIFIPNCSHIEIELVTANSETPDAIGWGSGRSVLLEAKCSRADFMRDAKKHFRKYTDKGMGNFRFYITPRDLIRYDELPEGWGLLEVIGRKTVMRVQPKYQQSNNEAEKTVLLSRIRRMKNE